MEKIGTKDDHDVMQCTDCGLIQVEYPDEKEYNKFYEEGQVYFDHSVIHGHQSFDARFDHDCRIAEPRVRNLMRHVKGGSLLDVGCGNGALVKQAADRGFLCTGVDLNRWLVDNAQRRVPGARFLCGELPHLDGQLEPPYSTITFIDSFEHLLDPCKYIEATKGLLEPDGVVVLEMPDITCDDFKRDGMGWRHMKPKEHAFLYGPEHIDALWSLYDMNLLDTVYTIPGRCIYYVG